MLQILHSFHIIIIELRGVRKSDEFFPLLSKGWGTIYIKSDTQKIDYNTCMSHEFSSIHPRTQPKINNNKNLIHATRKAHREMQARERIVNFKCEREKSFNDDAQLSWILSSFHLNVLVVREFSSIEMRNESLVVEYYVGQNLLTKFGVFFKVL